MLGRTVCLLSVLIVTACGGGGGGGGSGSGSQDGSAPESNVVSGSEQQPVVVSNRSPIVRQENADRSTTVGQFFDYDASQAGFTFLDPEHDPLSYQVDVGSLPTGLEQIATRIVGTPTETGTFTVTITATDGRGGTVSDEFSITVLPLPNRAPELARPNGYRFTDVGSIVDYDVTQGGLTFRDADGDALVYELSLLTSPRGLSVDGTRVAGSFDSVGLVRVKVTASDQRGGLVEDLVAIVAPAPESGKPSLPESSFIYEDESLSLPYLFRLSSQQVIPLWDTTPIDNPITNAGATLGRVLFYDKRLSITNTVSCGSCHQQAHGFAAPERFSAGFQGDFTTRNSMNLTNVRYTANEFYFSDHRASKLEALVPMPIEDPNEMGHTMELLEAKLRVTDFYPSLFEAAFGTAEVNRDRIVKALSQFLRALISYQSKFDRAFHGMEARVAPDPAAVFTPEELRGSQIFVQANCWICHDRNTHTSTRAANNGLDVQFTDPGVANGMFRAQSLRNVAVSAPYMHDGRFATLREVINHYNSGVRDGPFLASVLRENLQNEPLRLNLSEEDKDALEAFLNTLTDQEFLTDEKFSDPFP